MYLIIIPLQPMSVSSQMVDGVGSMFNQKRPLRITFFNALPGRLREDTPKNRGFISGRPPLVPRYKGHYLQTVYQTVFKAFSTDIHIQRSGHLEGGGVVKPPEPLKKKFSTRKKFFLVVSVVVSVKKITQTSLTTKLQEGGYPDLIVVRPLI